MNSSVSPRSYAVAHRLLAGRGMVWRVAVHEQVICALRALPAAIAVHRPVAADHRADARARRARRARPGSPAPACGSVSRPSVNACTITSSTPRSRASAISAMQVLQRGVHAAVGDEPDQVHPPAAGSASRSTSLRGQRAVGDRVVDAHEILAHDGAGAEVQMADLRVAHLPLGQADGAARRRQRRVREVPPQLVEHGRVAPARRRCPGPARPGPSRRARPGRRTATGRPAGRASRVAHRAAAAPTICANDSASSDAPPTSAPSTSASASSSAAFSGLTEPP